MDFLHSWAVVLGQIFRQIVSIRVMTLINTNVVASRHIKREEVLLPVAVRRSKTPELHFTNYRFSFCFVPFRFVSLHFVSQTTVSRKIFILVKLLRKHVMIIFMQFAFGTRKVQRLNQSRSKGRSKVKIPALDGQEERLSPSKLKQAFLINSDAELFISLIQCIRFHDKFDV